MYKHGAVIQDSQPFQTPKLLPCLLIDSLTGVDDERSTYGRGVVRLTKVTAKSQRMTPAIFPDDTYRKIFFSQFRPESVVVTNCRDPAEKIAYSAPPQANCFGYGMLSRNL